MIIYSIICIFMLLNIRKKNNKIIIKFKFNAKKMYSNGMWITKNRIILNNSHKASHQFGEAMLFTSFF